MYINIVETIKNFEDNKTDIVYIFISLLVIAILFIAIIILRKRQEN